MLWACPGSVVKKTLKQQKDKLNTIATKTQAADEHWSECERVPQVLPCLPMSPTSCGLHFSSTGRMTAMTASGV
jgi:hypothetical protein